jgi:hypothetical protein
VQFEEVTGLAEQQLSQAMEGRGYQMVMQSQMRAGPNPDQLTLDKTVKLVAAGRAAEVVNWPRCLPGSTLCWRIQMAVVGPWVWKRA